jgi:peptidoglycan-associated lipoprotein
MKSVSLLLALGLGAAVIAGASCGGNPPPQTPTPNADSAAAAERARQDSAAAAQAERDRQAREEADRVAKQREADSIAALARASEEVRTTLATMIHFDLDKSNIGSDEYNLALGNRRAQAAKQYLVSHGIDASRIETQSWGEEKPLVDGHDESAWSQNRRDEFEVTSGGDNLRRS